jgi:hypothetical protein
METTQTTTLQLPSFLHGSYSVIKRKARSEGQRCAEQHQTSGSYTLPTELRSVTPTDVVFTHEVADFQDENPAWRLYAYWESIMSLCETLEKSYRHINTAHEAFFSDTPWGALFFAISGAAPDSAERSARRLGAVLRSWDSLQHSRYLHKKLGAFLTLEELLTAACGWAMEAWCPSLEDSVRSRLEVAAERMARATREDCTEALLRRLPHILVFADRKKLHHPEIVTSPAAWREHLSTLDDAAFERLSGVQPGEVLRRMYQWDNQLDIH